MDMKKILQAMDKGNSPIARADEDMKRFVSIIAEGKGPLNRPTQAEQIAVQHYTKVEQPVLEKKMSTSIDKYFKLVENEIIDSTQKVESKKKEKAKKIADHAIEEVSGNRGYHSNLSKHLSRTARPPASIIKTAKSGARVDNNMRSKIHKEETEGVDSVTLDIPLLIRLLEFAREDAKDDMILHQVVEKMTGMAEEGQSLTMSDYESIIGKIDETCWKDYKQVGMKKKGGKAVPNCVPKK